MQVFRITTAQKVRALELAEECGRVSSAVAIFESLRQSEPDHTAPEGFPTWLDACKARLEAAQKHERKHGRNSLLRAEVVSHHVV